MESHTQEPAGPQVPWAVLCALPEELGSLAGAVRRKRTVAGQELLELELEGRPLLAAVAGVGKVRAAGAAAILCAEGAAALLVVGVCGGLRRALAAGDLVHCSRAVQADLAVRADREVEPDPALLAGWRAAAPGRLGWFLTADRPVLNPWRRLRLARAFASAAVADMETAAAARVASAAGVPWAALRAVTDGAGFGSLASFQVQFPRQAGRAADTVAPLLREWGARGGSPAGVPPSGSPT